MGAASGIRAGRAFVEFFADKSPFVRGLRSMERDFKAFGARINTLGALIGGVGTAIAAGLAGAVTAFTRLGDSLAKMSQRTGAGVESLSALGYAAEQNGSSLDQIAGAMTKVRGDIAAFAQGNWDAAKSLTKLGINVLALARMKPEDQFALIAERISRIRNPALQAAIATEAFGSAGESLLPLLKQGSAGIQAWTDRARELGLVMSTEDAAAAEQLNRSFLDLTGTIRGLWNRVGAALTPELLQLSQRIVALVADASAWAANNQKTIVLLAKFAVAAIAVGGVLVTLGTGIAALGAVLGGLATIAVTVGTVLGSIGTVVSFLLGPWGTLLRLVTSGTIAFLKFTDVGQSLTSTIGGAFADLAATLSGTWGGIVDALSAGDLELAGQVAFTGLQLLWLQVTSGITSAWDSVVKYLLDRWDVATADFRSFFVDAWAVMQSAAVISTAAIADAWDYTVTFLQNAWQSSGISDGFKLLGEQWQLTVTDMQALWAWLVTEATNLWTGFVETFGVVSAGISGAWEALTAGMSELWAIFAGGVSAIADTIVGAWTVVTESLRFLWEPMVAILTSVWKTFADALAPYLQPFLDVFNGITGYLQGAWKGMTDFFSTMWQALTSGMITDFRGAQAFIAKGIAYITAKIQGLDPAEVMKEIDDQLARDRATDKAANDARIAERDKKVGERAVQTGAELTKIAGERQAGQAAAQDPVQAKLDTRQAEFDAKAKAAADALQAARDKADAARLEAAEKAKAAAADAGKGVATVQNKQYDLGTVAKQSTAGTFSAAAAARMSGTTDPILQENQRQTKLLAQLVNNRAAFA